MLGKASLAALLLATSAGRPAVPAFLEGQVHDRWTQRDGLPHNMVVALLVARSGYLWLGTQEGLVRFDGARFTLFDRATTPGLAGDQITALCEDARGDLWIGTNTGLSVMRGERFEAVDPGGAPRATIQELLRDGTDLWALTDSGLRLLRDGLWSGPAAEQGLNELQAIGPAPRGVWVGGRGGIARWDGTRFARDEGEGLPRGNVAALLEDATGRLWVATPQGLWRRPAGGAIFAPVPGFEGKDVRALLPGSEGALWAGTQIGAARVLGDRVEWVAGGPVGVRRLASDVSGSVWYGTAADGLHRVRRSELAAIGPEQGLSSRVVWSVMVRADGSVLAAGDGGLDQITGRRPAPFRPDLTRQEGLTTLLEDGAGDLWVGSDNRGVLRISGRAARWYGPAEGVRSDPRVLFGGRDGTVWLGTREGLLALRGERFEPVAPSDGPVGVIGEDGLGRLWVGTTRRLARLEGSVLVPVALPDCEGPVDVTALHFDADGAAWVGTAGAGLFLVRERAGRVFTRREGLPENQVFAILDDGRGYLWLSGNHGITRVSRSELEAVASGRAPTVAATALGRGDGMVEVECSGGIQPSAARTADGRLWFPTIHGLVIADPATILQNPEAPQVALEELLLDGARRPMAGAQRLAPGTHHVHIRYTATALASADRVRFRHRLLGLEEAFVDAGQSREVHYAGLGPGQYLFQLSAANESGVWSERWATLAFEIEPRFWQTPWFAFLLAAAGALLAVGLFAFATRRLRARSQRLATQVDEEAAKVRALSNLLPVCAWCRKIKDQEGSWQTLEQWVTRSGGRQVTHGMCPACYERTAPDDGAGI